MNAMSTITRLTWEEFLNVPEKPGKQELLNGELIEMPPARFRHDEIIQQIQFWLVGFLARSRVWAQSGYRMRAGWLIPDVSVSWPDQPIEDGWRQGAPMLAIEVVSPANNPEYLDQKVAAYFAEGAAEVWIVYPQNHSMMLFSEAGRKAVRITGTFRSDCLGVEGDIAELTR